jgi:hypothetical protein
VAPSSSSSTKKAARLAAKGTSRGVKFQGGSLFPLIVALVVILGLGTVVYARQSIPADDITSPTINDHWHVGYGFYICGEWYTLGGELEEVDSQGRLVNTPYLQTGVHSHNDGVVHWHAFTSRAVGRRATLGVFFDVYGVEMTNQRLKFPDGQPAEGIVGQEFIPGETQCDGKDAELSVVVWNNFADTGEGIRYIANFENIRIQNDGMVFAMVYMPRGEPVPVVPWAANLPALGAVDMGVTVPTDPTEPTEGTGDTGDTDTDTPDESDEQD